MTWQDEDRSPMSYQELGFTEAQWDVLKRGPMYMLACVGGVDSHIDAVEWSALIDAVIAGAEVDDALVRGVLGALAEDLHEAPRGNGDGLPPLDGLGEVRKVLEGYSGDEGRSFREALLEIGATIADSSGAQLTMTFAAHHGTFEPASPWVFSSGTSPMETEALLRAAAALGLSITP
jgi:hypothetical protein